MNVTIEELGPCKKLIRIEVDSEAVESEFKTVTQDFQRHAQIPGFRAGKAPRAFVEKNYGAKIAEEVSGNLKRNGFRKAVDEHKLKVLGLLNVEDVATERGDAWIFTATAELEPEFSLPEYKGLSIEVETAPVTDADVDGALATLQERAAEMKDVAKALEMGDYAIVNYTATSDGKPLTDFSPTAKGMTEQKEYQLPMIEGTFLPGFAAQLVGASVGDHRTVNVEFPGDFFQPKLAGLTAVYEVDVVGVKQRVKPELNDEFATTLGAESLEKLREYVRGDLENEANYKRKQGVQNGLINALLQAADFELPESMVMSETRSSVYDIVMQNQQRGINKEIMDQHKDEIFNAANAKAKGRVKFSFLVERIAEAETIEVTNQELAQRVSYMAMQNEMKPEKMAKKLREENRLEEVRGQVLSSKVLEFLEQHANITEVAPKPAEEAAAEAAAEAGEAPAEA